MKNVGQQPPLQYGLIYRQCDKYKNYGIILINELLNSKYFSPFKVLYFHMKSIDNSFNNSCK